MRDKYFYIIDIKYKQTNKAFDDLKSHIKVNSELMSLTPYSSYILNKLEIEYKRFHNIISIEEFRDNLMNEYNKIGNIFDTHKDFSYMFYYLALIKTKQMYYKVIEDFISIQKDKNYRVIYITDTKSIDFDMNSYNFMSNSYSLIHTFKNIDKIIDINHRDSYFYFRKKITYTIYKIIDLKEFFIKIKKYILKKRYKLTLSYDNINFNSFFKNREYQNIKVPLKSIKQEYELIKIDLSAILKVDSSSDYLNNMYKQFFSSFENILNSSSKIENIKVQPFVFLSNHFDMIRTLIYKENNIPKVFMQHGSYLHENITLKYCEIYPADINFVFNDYTKELFEKRGAKRVEVIGSINFNKEIKVKKNKYDYLYITFCSNYTYSGTFIGMQEAIVSMDGMNIYDRHKYIIELFGNRFKSKKICIKIQPNIMLSHLYIPLIELSQSYNNITIEFVSPLHSLIEQSKYILSDYFSSEFTNRELHYKKDIILFSNSPFPLEENILEDMNKIFILCEDETKLLDIVSNIEYITQNREKDRYVIEKYTSKEYDTKIVANSILENCFDRR